MPQRWWLPVLVPFFLCCLGCEPPLELDAQFTAAPVTGRAPLSVQCDASASRGAVSRCEWDFGDGGRASGVQVTHLYTAAGSFTITLTVYDSAGKSNSESQVVVVSAGNRRSWPDTGRGIHVFNDQLDTRLSDAQIRFAATRYAGTQKMTRFDADRLRFVNPGFLILHYRLGLGLGYRATLGTCNPVGEWLHIISGDWVQEWPVNVTPLEEWFYHWPETGGNRVFQCTWGWFLMEPRNTSWRAYWLQQVATQLRDNDNDGLFLDSINVPNYLGATSFQPALPEVDSRFESAWSLRIQEWLQWLQTTTVGEYSIVTNVGSWITTRDATDYGAADGVMVEGFVLEADQSPYAFDDWRLQMNRIAAAVRRNQIVILQNYAGGMQERMFSLGCYLLVKGNNTYLNIDIGEGVEWWPEYSLPIGRAQESLTSQIDDLDRDHDRIYRREYDNAIVLVNPTNPWDGSGKTVTVDLGDTHYQAVCLGGGFVDANGASNAAVNYSSVKQVTLTPFSAAVLFKSEPQR